MNNETFLRRLVWALLENVPKPLYNSFRLHLTKEEEQCLQTHFNIKSTGEHIYEMAGNEWKVDHEVK